MCLCLCLAAEEVLTALAALFACFGGVYLTQDMLNFDTDGNNALQDWYTDWEISYNAERDKLISGGGSDPDPDHSSGPSIPMFGELLVALANGQEELSADCWNCLQTWADDIKATAYKLGGTMAEKFISDDPYGVPVSDLGAGSNYVAKLSSNGYFSVDGKQILYDAILINGANFVVHYSNKIRTRTCVMQLYGAAASGIDRSITISCYKDGSLVYTGVSDGVNGDLGWKVMYQEDYVTDKIGRASCRERV